MAAPILTIRGREISEPAFWAVGGALVFLTPLPVLVALPLVMSLGLTDSALMPAVILLAALGLLTWWAAVRPNRVSVRAWSAGVWFATFIATFFVGSELLGRVENALPLTDWLWTAITVVFGLGVLFVASPFYAWAAFTLGQRWFSPARRPSPPAPRSTCNGGGTAGGNDMSRFGRVGLAAVTLGLLFGVFFVLTLPGLPPAESAWISMLVSSLAFWVLADRFVGRPVAYSASSRSLPRLVVGALFLLVLGLAWAIGGRDTAWRVALVLAPVAIGVSAYMFGRGSASATV